MLREGEPAPQFELPNAEMNMVSLDAFRGKGIVVLYFYVKDDTPGCTLEAIDFTDHEDAFRRLDARVMGISMDDCLAHCAFRDRHGLAVELLSDEDGEVCRRYDVLQEKQFEGGSRCVVQRSTFVIDRQGRVARALYGVRARGHVREVLNILEGMQ
jgi:peroxiredoxin Q/BCP